MTPDYFDSLKNTFLKQIKTIVKFENILVFNKDQTGLNYVPIT